MRAINQGNEFHIFDDSTQLYDALPAQMYQIEFDPRRGYSLSKYGDITIGEKVYGVHEQKVSKVMDTFRVFERSLGVILSGDKGIGKSLFSKMLCIKAISEGYPVLVCNGYTDGIAQFIESINQQIVVIFDEFDKTFDAADEESGEKEQTSMLSLFDGMSTNKKLFCVTCNNLNKLNSFLVNRPGRFHYHFRFEYPTSEEIREYMQDHIPEDKYPEIDKVIEFARKADLNYDCLRAISFELHSNPTFEDAIADLNIVRSDAGHSYHLYLLFEDGYIMKLRYTKTIDPFDSDPILAQFGSESEAEANYLQARFSPLDMTYNIEAGGMTVPFDKLNITMDQDETSWALENHKDFVLAHSPQHVTGLVARRDISGRARSFFVV